MAMTMDDDGAILVHLTNPGGIVGGTGVANQVAYWTDTDTIGGDPGLTYNAATDSLTIAGNILMADDHFIGITGDIRIEFDQTDGDIMLHLGDAAGADEVQVVDSGGVVVTYMDSDGNASFEGHIAIGVTATVQSNILIYARETTTAIAGGVYGLAFTVEFAPSANFGTTVFGLQGEILVTTAFARTGGNIVGLKGVVRGSNGITTSGLWMYAGDFTTDVNDMAADRGRGISVYTPFVDTGSCVLGYGIYIGHGNVGAGSITTLYGMYIAAITNGNTNYAIYSAGGNSYHAGKMSIGGTVAPLAQLHVDQSSTSGAIPVLYLDQADVSEEMIEFACTIGAGNAIEAVGGKTLTTTHFIKISLPGALTRYIPVGTIA